jgi:hypothetical protein
VLEEGGSGIVILVMEIGDKELRTEKFTLAPGEEVWFGRSLYRNRGQKDLEYSVQVICTTNGLAWKATIKEVD